MSDYPGAVDTFRTPANIPGQDYDPAKLTTIYSEDFSSRSDAIIALEETLGVDPQGGSPTVNERIGVVESDIAGITTGLPYTDDPDWGREIFIDYIGGLSTAAVYLDMNATMGGTLTLHGAPTSDLHASTKKYVDDGLATKQASIGYTPENAANKSTATALGASDSLYPSQKAVKTYVDGVAAGKQDSLGYTPEAVANKSTSGALGASDTLYPSQKAVRTYVDNAVAAVPAGFTPDVQTYPYFFGTYTMHPNQTVYAVPFYAAAAGVYNRISMDCVGYSGSNSTLEMGVYDASRALIGKASLTLNSTGLKTVTLSTPITLAPGTKYYLVSLDSSSSSLNLFTSYNPTLGATLKTENQSSVTALGGTFTNSSQTNVTPWMQLWKA